MIRALFFDLDGTLLTTDRRLSDANAAALAACRERGIKLFVATARPPRLANILGWGEREFSLFDGGIYYNGGCISLEGKKHYQYIPADIVSGAYDIVRSCPDLHIALQMTDEIHALNHDLATSAHERWGVTLDELLPIDDSCMDRTAKLIVYWQNFTDCEIPVPDDVVKRLHALCDHHARFYVTDQGRLVQITALESNKASAIRRVAVRLGLREDEIAVFGDDYNDLEMIRAFPESVAMGNVCPELKAAAKYVTLSNDDDGIAHALKQLLHLL